MGDVQFYLRDGGSALPIPVQVVQDPTKGGVRLYQVVIEGVTRSFPSARQLLTTLAFGGTDRHWTLDRYLRQGRHSPTHLPAEPTLPILEALRLWCLQATETIITASGLVVPVAHPAEVTVPKTSDQACPETEARLLKGLADQGLTLGGHLGEVLGPCDLSGTPTLGIDLARRGHEVAKLLYAGFGSRLYASGYDPEEVLQEVFKGILTRNRGRSAFDPRKSSFGHYVHLVCSCILSNYHRKVSRTRSKETPLTRWANGEEGGDEQDSKPLSADVFGASDQLVQEDFRTYLVQWAKAHPQGDPASALALEILPLVRTGCERAEIAQRVGTSRVVVSRALSHLRARAAEWVQGQAGRRTRPPQHGKSD